MSRLASTDVVPARAPLQRGFSVLAASFRHRADHRSATRDQALCRLRAAVGAKLSATDKTHDYAMTQSVCLLIGNSRMLAAQ